MQYLFPDEYAFVPRTWVLPEDFSELAIRVAKDVDSKATYIVKPDGLSQGRGIFLTDDLERLRRCSDECREKGEGVVVQKYLAKPMLLDGLKFDMRIYLLVVGGSAGIGSDMRLFLFRDGLVRLCTTEYESPTPETFDQVQMHITNYEINRYSASFNNPTSARAEAEDGNLSNKRSMGWFLDHVEAQYGRSERQRIWSDVTSICVKTVLAAQPTLDAEYDACFNKDLTKGGMGCRSFEILGFDIMLTSQRKAYLLEVNHMPSLGCDSPLDYDIKRRLVDQTLDLTCVNIDTHITKSSYEEIVASSNIDAPSCGGLLDLPTYKDFDRVYPSGSGCTDELSSLSTTIADKMRDKFVSVMSSRPRSVTPPPLSLLPCRSSDKQHNLRRQCAPAKGRATSRPRSPASVESSLSSPESKTGVQRRRATAKKPAMSRSSSAPSITGNSNSDKNTPRQRSSVFSTTSEPCKSSAWSRASDRGLTNSASTGRISGKAARSSSAAKQSVVRACMLARLPMK
jgi:hypothetical protein